MQAMGREARGRREERRRRRVGWRQRICQLARCVPPPACELSLNDPPGGVAAQSLTRQLPCRNFFVRPRCAVCGAGGGVEARGGEKKRRVAVRDPPPV